MRLRTGFLALALLLLPASAKAGVLSFTGTFGIQLGTLQPIEVAVAGTATLNGSGALGALGSITLAGGTFAILTTVPITDPIASPIQGMRLDLKNGPGAFSLDGLMALPGTVTLCLFGACTASPVANVVVPFTQNGTRGVGLGGGPLTSMGLVNTTVQGAGWTVGTAVVPGFPPMTRMGFVHGPASGGASSAAAVSGAVQLVTPVATHSNLGPDGDIPLFGMFTIEFVPEPGTLALSLAGAFGLAVLARRRMRS
jgi:hypothetical protein